MLNAPKYNLPSTNSGIHAHNTSPGGFYVRVELIPSSVSHAEDESAPQFLSSYLIGDSLVIDGGSVGLLADIARQKAIQHIFLTHAHLDHVASLPLFVETVYSPGPDCVEVLAHASILRQIRRDFFNNVTWPDFIELSTADDAFMKFTPIDSLTTVERSGYRITPVPVHHTPDTYGMIVDDGESCVVFAADTGPTEKIWEEIAQFSNLKAVLLECSFPDDMEAFATKTGHLCPRTFVAQCKQIAETVRIITVHRKARYRDAIAKELRAYNLPNVEIIKPGMAYIL